MNKEKIAVTELDVCYYLVKNYQNDLIDLVGDEQEYYLYYGSMTEKLLSYDDNIKDFELQRFNNLCNKLLSYLSLSLKEIVENIRDEQYLLKVNSGSLTKSAVKKT
jgi:hypothetical protein